MPLLRVNAMAFGAGVPHCAESSGLQLHGSTRGPAGCLAGTSRTEEPTVIMVHGFKYAPYDPLHCPHRKIFAASGWPADLGRHDGLTVAFGWHARSALRTAYSDALAQGAALARLISMLRVYNPQKPVHIIAHSLGASVAMAALPHLRAGDVGRIVLLTGACHGDLAQTALATDAGCATQVLNVISRENDIFDFAFERLVPGSGAIGRGLGRDNVVDLQIDCDLTLPVLAQLGHFIGPAQRRVCHWSAYTRPGLMQLYATFLHQPGVLPVDMLHSVLPQQTTPRWSRLHPAPALAARLKTRIMARNKRKGPTHEHAY